MRNGFIIPGLCLFLAAGCISHHETVYRDAPRAKVQFENDRAGRLFYETLNKRPKANHRTSNTSISIPVVFDHHTEVKAGENEAFNAAVRDCDTSQDGIITENEAVIFSERYQK
jgi:hypothetical protein